MQELIEIDFNEKEFLEINEEIKQTQIKLKKEQEYLLSKEEKQLCK